MEFKLNKTKFYVFRIKKKQDDSISYTLMSFLCRLLDKSIKLSITERLTKQMDNFILENDIDTLAGNKMYQTYERN